MQARYNLGTVYGDAVCTRCGLPTGLGRSSTGLCGRCYGTRHEVERITREYVARLKGIPYPTCPYDAIAHYESEALEAYTPNA